MENHKAFGTPMVTRCQFYNKGDPSSAMQARYISMIWGLQYLIHTRLDIADVVEIFVRFKEDPKETHFVAVNKIFRYLEGIIDFGLWYDKSNGFTLYAYIDDDWERNVNDIKSTSGGGFFLSERLISCLIKKKIVLFSLKQR